MKHWTSEIHDNTNKFWESIGLGGNYHIHILCIYMFCMTISLSDSSIFPCSRFMWVPQVLQVVSLFRDLSWSLSCPLYCGSSVIPIFLSGFLLGLLFGLCLCAAALWYLDFYHRSSTDPPVAPVVLGRSGPTRSRSRLAGYLHEWFLCPSYRRAHFCCPSSYACHLRAGSFCYCFIGRFHSWWLGGHWHWVSGRSHRFGSRVCWS